MLRVRVFADHLAIHFAAFNRSANRLLSAGQGKEWCKLQMAGVPPVIELSRFAFEPLWKDEELILYRGRSANDGSQAAFATRLAATRPESSETQIAGSGHDEASAESGYGAPSDLGRDAGSMFGRDEASRSRVLVLAPVAEHSPPECLKRLEYDAYDGRSAATISVKDFGIGLKKEEMERLFNAFYTTKPQGLGMGLAISRSIVEEHGDRLWAEPNKGPGATFLFSLPAADRVHHD
jgi:hypothetical protein